MTKLWLVIKEYGLNILRMNNYKNKICKEFTTNRR